MIDYSLYLVTDRALSLGRSNREVVEAAVKGGVSCVQIREKECSTRDFVLQAKELQELLSPLGIPLIVNDRVDVALAVAADGIHLGQTDMTITDARRIAGDDIIIGVSVESVDDAILAEQQGADYIGISPVFATPTKEDTGSPLGISGIEEINRNISIPMVGIGGINSTNTKEIILAGADGIAVVSAIVAAPSPELAARELRQLITTACREKNGNL